tara:strand:- start:2798 stop:3172 length:375 start_codon:yes stop_codon:yes gene_type:complete
MRFILFKINLTQQPNTNQAFEKLYKLERYRGFFKNADANKTLNPDTPHNSKSLYVYVGNKLEKFLKVIHRRLVTNIFLVFERQNPLAHALSVRGYFCLHGLGEEYKLAHGSQLLIAGRNVWPEP